MEYYYNELYHHGILGQKWGVRRYQNEDGSLTSAGKDRYSGEKKGMLQRAKIRGQGSIEEFSTAIQRARDAKGIRNKSSELFGYGRSATSAEIRSKTEKKLAAASRTRLGQRFHEQHSTNAKYAQEYYEAKQSQDLGQRIFESTIANTTLMNTPYERLSGRTTTIGKNALDIVLTGGIAGLVLDAQYMANNRNKSNN